MGERPFTARGLRMLAMLPPKLQGSVEHQAVIHAQSRELDRLEGCIEQVRAQFNPATADILLNAWEYSLKLPVGGAGADIPTRQQRVVVRLQKLLGQAEGIEWEDQITALIGGGWSYLEHIPGDGTSPPANTLRITLPFSSSSGSYLAALQEIAEVTPAHLEIEFESAAGFQLDDSPMDITGMTY